MGVWLLYKIILITHGKVHPYQPLFEATLGRRRGTCSKKRNGELKKKQRTKLNLYLPDMPRRLRRSLLKENSWRRSSSLLPRAEVESESWTQDEKIKTGVETRVSERKAFSPEETSESYAHAFHFPTMANQQTIALSGKIKERKWSIEPGPPRRTAQWLTRKLAHKLRRPS